MNIEKVSSDDLPRVIEALGLAALPVKDIGDNVELYVLKTENRVMGTVGMEHNNSVALLRSLSVDRNERGKGYGESLVRFLEDSAAKKSVRTIYLLTTSAATFFSRHGYQEIKRDKVPEFIKETTEFSSVCPSSAIVMKKQLL